MTAKPGREAQGNASPPDTETGQRGDASRRQRIASLVAANAIARRQAQPPVWTCLVARAPGLAIKQPIPRSGKKEAPE